MEVLICKANPLCGDDNIEDMVIRITENIPHAAKSISISWSINNIIYY